MLQQSLPIHSITAAARSLCAGLRSAAGKNLMDVDVSVAVVVYELLQKSGVPGNAIRMVLTPEELREIGDVPEAHPSLVAKCAYCQDEAQQLVKTRYGLLLVCDCCADQIKHE